MATGAYKVAFFQDEYTECGRRFAFLDECGIDCVYTCLEPDQFDAVYGRSSRCPGRRPRYGLRERHAAARGGALRQARRRARYRRGLPRPAAPAYLGRGAQEKDEIGRRFRARAAGTGLRLDIAGAEADRLYGDAWYRFFADCRCVLGVESGVSAFDLEDEVLAEYREQVAAGRTPTVDDLASLRRWDGMVDLRTISPRHFEAAAFRVCQVLYEGRYAGVLEPMRHYIPLRKDYRTSTRWSTSSATPRCARR